MANNYKALKEAFVSNLSGGSPWEINAVALVQPSAVVLWSVLQSRQRAFTPYTLVACVTDVLINCGAILCATTIYSSAPLLLNLLLILPAIATYITSPQAQTYKKPMIPPRTTSKTAGNASSEIQEEQRLSSRSQQDPFPVKPFLTMYRGAMMAITCAAILAVDFRVFPRRFAKVENWGTSLMDMGVGSFVYTAGTVAAKTVLKENVSGRPVLLGQRLVTSMRHSLPLLVLGLIRLYSVKGLDYAEHVTEYGVHWNFFFTLGLLPPFVAVFHSAFKLVPSYAALAILLGVGYQIALESTDLQTYILIAPRTDLLSKNREGVFSFLGYLAIFLAGHSTGMYVLPREIPGSESASMFQRFRTSMLGKLCVWSVIWISLFVASTSYHLGTLQVSRRLANLPYFLWVSAFNTTQLALCCLIERLCFPGIYTTASKEAEQRRCKDATSRVLHAYNRNGLAVFLLANLLTGLVNLTLPTLHMGDLQAMGVLVGYMGVLSAIALALDAWDISIKL
ncbi:GPI-anchored wall transfer protein 1 [Aulographum hederae CBS 113979]|uniref:GPI-anchored wall transfer protein n=1 Tax=Aulographum hederae CBS 113979 TaxID=1176131 RepID=A0A6G1GXK8_9PEZI|nr:GPI-anchored wall transfer protein 1 [Aulographum hederae CBS 113979]